MKRIRIKINTGVSLGGYPGGSEVSIKVTDAGIPIEQYWRRRFEDAKMDNCISIIEPKKVVKKEGK